MLHKTGSRAVESEGLTTQQWAVLGALSREVAHDGMSVGDLARYLKVTRQNLSGVISRMERDGHVLMEPDAHDRRSRIIKMTAQGKQLWEEQATPKIHAYYDVILQDFSVNDVTHALHYLLKMLDGMTKLDEQWLNGRPESEQDADAPQ